MIGNFGKYFVVFATGLVVTLIITPLVRAAAIRFGIVDLPNERRPHKRPTARGGGLAVVLGVNGACLAAMMFSWPELAAGAKFAWWTHWLLPSSILVVLGLIDDVRGLSPKIKLSGQALVALLVWFSGTHFASFFGFKLPLKVSGSEGFLILFDWLDDNNWTWWNIGGWGNTLDAIEQMNAGSKGLISPQVSETISANVWYDIRVVLTGPRIQCYLNNTLIQDVTNSVNGAVAASASYVTSTGQVIIKAVNTTGSIHFTDQRGPINRIFGLGSGVRGNGGCQSHVK